MRISDWSSDVCSSDLDRVFTGDTLHVGGTGRTDLPTGDPDALYDSLFNRLLTLDPDIMVFPGHDYSGRKSSRSEEHTSELQSLMRISYAVFCLKKKNNFLHTSLIL